MKQLCQSTLLLIVFLMAFAGTIGAQTLVINEYLAANDTSLADSDGDFSDWLELYNTSGDSVWLGELFLTDDSTSTAKWQLPAAWLFGHQTIIIWASGKDRRGLENHTNFKLSALSGYIGLFGPSGQIDALSTPSQFPDVAAARVPHGSGPFTTTLQPTPGDSNVFEPVPPMLRVSRPKPNELVVAGSDYEITWSSTAGSGEFVALEISLDGGLNWFAIDASTKNDGIKPWLVPTQTSTRALIRVISLQNAAVADTMAGAFEIISPPVGANALRINEFVASNKTVVADDQGDFSDWLELYNDSSDSVSLDGMSLTDDSTNINKWTLPDLSLPPYGFVLIWASGKDRKGVTYHTNFKLSASGEFLGLYSAENQLIDALNFEPQIADIATARIPDGSGPFDMTAQPTPGSANISTPLPTGTLAFNVPGGFYSGAINLVLSSDIAGAEIRYTTDGSSVRSDSQLMGGSLPISETTILRARGYLGQIEVTGDSSQLYVFGADRQLPVLSLATDEDNLYGETGILDNTSASGRAWEKPAVIDYLVPNGEGFSIKAGIRTHGGLTRSRSFPKQSFRLYFRSEYGSSKLKFKLFESKDLDIFDRLIVHSGGSSDQYYQPWRINRQWSLIRDPVNHEVWSEEGGLVSASQPIILLLNGKPHGIYHIRERIDDAYIESNFGDKDVDLLKPDLGNLTVVNGDLDEWNQTISYFENNDLSIEANYRRALELIDIDNYTDFIILNTFIGNWDTPHTNNFMYRPRSPEAKWYWILWDTDISFGSEGNGLPVTTNTLEWMTREAPMPDFLGSEDHEGNMWSNLYLRKLLENPQYKAHFINRFSDLMNTILLPERIHAKFDRHAERIESNIHIETEKWPEATLDDWRNGVVNARAWAAARPAIQRNHIRDKFSLGRDLEITVDADASRGDVQVNSIIPGTYPWSGRYFEGVTQKIKAIPKPGFRFAGWQGASGDSPAIELNLTTDKSVTALFADAVVELEDPGEGSRWFAGDEQLIQWSSDGLSDSVALDYSLDGGNTWLPIATVSGSEEQFVWEIPDSTTGPCQIRITDLAAPHILDQTESLFSISQPFLMISAPGGGEDWLVGLPWSVEWQSDGASDRVDLSMSLDGGLSWMTIADSIANSGQYIWIPDTTGSEVLVRVQDSAKPQLSDQIENALSLLQPALTLATPNGAELWLPGSQQIITWHSQNLPGQVGLSYSLDGGASWHAIADSVEDTGEFSWPVPDSIAYNAQVRVWNTTYPAISDTSDSTFVVEPPETQRIPVVTRSFLDAVNDPAAFALMDRDFAAVLLGIMTAFVEEGDPGFLTYVRQWADAHVDGVGSLDAPVTDYLPGAVLLTLHSVTEERRYLEAGFKFRDAYVGSPRLTENGAVITAQGDQVWLDGLYGLTRFLGILAHVTRDSDYLVQAADQFLSHALLLSDSTTGLFSHGYDADASAPWADPVSKRSQALWALGNGWALSALVDLIEVLPVSYLRRDSLITLSERLSLALLAEQDPDTGIWPVLLQTPDDERNLPEAAATALILRGLQKALVMELIDPDNQQAINRGNDGLNRLAHVKNGSAHTLINVADVSDIGPPSDYLDLPRGSGFEYPHGVGAFLEHKATYLAAPAYELPWANLNVAVQGAGQVSLNPPGGFYNVGTPVEINAIADSGWLFIGWQGDHAGMAETDTLIINQAISLTAGFRQLIPQIDSLSPAAAHIGGVVALKGRDLAEVVVVSFNGTEAMTFNAISDTLLEVYVPPLAQSGPLTLNNPWQSSTSQAVFEVLLVPEPQKSLWLSPAEIARLPVSGPAWEALRATADKRAGRPDLNDKDDATNINILAKALVFARTGEVAYRDSVVQSLQVIAFETPESGGRTLALGRELAAYVIAADLIGLAGLDPALDTQFRLRLRELLTKQMNGWGSPKKTLVETHEQRANNWGTHAGATRAAIARYLGDSEELERTAHVFKGWVGDRQAYSGFEFADDLSWQCDPDNPVAINPAGCENEGHDIDGALPEEMRRGASFQWPPAETQYAWGGLQGAIVQAELLHRAGYPAWEWQDKALLRATRFLHRIGWEAEGDDEWQPWLINFAYADSFAAELPARPGKNMSWTDWTHPDGRLARPEIEAFVPLAGPIGTDIEIVGHGFRGTSDVLINGQRVLEYIIASDSLIQAVVPDGAISGPVTVINPMGTGVSSSSYVVSIRFEITSPNGGESWHVGSEQQVVWQSTTQAFPVRIDLSPDHGRSWQAIADSIANTGSFPWVVPAMFSDSSLIRVSDRSTTQWQDVSDSAFAIRAAELDLLSPNGGERLYQGSTHSIAWMTAGRIDSVRVDYSHDHGTTWEDLSGVIANSGQFPWVVPSVSFDSVMVRVVDATDPAKSDQSDSLFMIEKPKLTLLSPNGGESWLIASERAIEWQSEGPIERINIDWSLDSAKTWSALARDVENNGQYSLVIPDTLSDQALVSIFDKDNPSTNDRSDSLFSIVKPPLDLLSPRGGEAWVANSLQTLEWQDGSAGDSVALAFSSDMGLAWRLIAVVPNTGSYEWQVPDDASDRCLIRVSTLTDPVFSEQSPAPFAIYAANNVLTSPIGGETWQGTETEVVTWNPTQAIAQVHLDFSMNAGATWQRLATAVPNSGFFSLLAPENSSDYCLIRVTDAADSLKWVQSPAFFSLRTQYPPGRALRFDGVDDFAEIPDNPILSGGPGKSLTVETWVMMYEVTGEQSLIIKFRDSEFKDWGLRLKRGAPEVSIENYGDDWSISTGSVSAGVWTHLAFAFSNDANNVKLYINGRVVGIQNLHGDMPDTEAPIYLGRHAYRDEFLNGVLDEMRIWDHARSAEEISAGMYRKLTGSEQGLLAYWSFEQAPSDSSAGTNENLRDHSVHGNEARLGATFEPDDADPEWLQPGVSLIPPEDLTLLKPAAGDSLVRANETVISWKTTGSVPDVRIEYSLDGGLSWLLLESRLPNTGTYSWTAPDILSQGLVRVSDAADMSPMAVSAPFPLIKPYLRLRRPAIGDTWFADASEPIHWQSLGLPDLLDIAFSPDGGQTWTGIAERIENNGEYSWQVPRIESDNGLLRIASSQRPDIADTLKGAFKIKLGSLTLLSPNGGEAWQAGSDQEISWISSGPVEKVDLHLSLNGGETWSAVAQDASNTGKMIWPVPPELSPTALIRITDSNRDWISDNSDSLFSVVGIKDSMRIIINADDFYQLWVNGEKIGFDSQWDVAQTYVVAAPPGKNVIAIEGRNRGSAAGVIAEVYMNDLLILKTDTSWRYTHEATSGWTDIEFNQSSWKRILDLGRYGASPWGRQIDGISSNSPAHWIWGEGSILYFRGSFAMPSDGVITEVDPQIQDVKKAWIPSNFALLQNYPNPFNPTTAVQFDLPQQAHVSLQVFDLLGRRVKTLVDQEMVGGRHSVIWDGRGVAGQVVPGGVYLIRMTAGSFVAVRKAVLIK